MAIPPCQKLASKGKSWVWHLHFLVHFVAKNHRQASNVRQPPMPLDGLQRWLVLKHRPELNEALSDKEPLQRIRLVCKEDIFAPNPRDFIAQGRSGS